MDDFLGNVSAVETVDAVPELKTKPEIVVEYSMAFGRETFYACDGLGGLLLELMGRRSFTRDKLERLKKHFDIKIKQKQV